MTAHEKKAFHFDHSWAESANSLWLATTLDLHRNIDQFHFPHKLDSAKRQSVSDLIEHSLDQSMPIFEQKSVAVVSFDELLPIDKEYFTEHFLIFNEVLDGVNGRRVITDGVSEIAVQVHFRDHIQIHAIDIHGTLEKTVDKMIAIERYIEKKLPYAYSEDFGYLTSDVSICGTGLIVKAYLHLPALIMNNRLASWIVSERHGFVSYEGIQGSSKDFLGDLVVITNKYTLGMTEEMIISSVRAAALQLMSEETLLRNTMKEEARAPLMDRFSRAIGILHHCYEIDTSESLKLLSLIKFGIELGWISGMESKDLNRLLLECRRAHLSKTIASDEAVLNHSLYMRRAELLHHATEKLTLIKKL